MGMEKCNPSCVLGSNEKLTKSEQEEETVMDFQPPEILPGKRGSWLRKDAWTGKSLF